jgi:folate-dependent phosphoribosylglycinamide formyltransferase PurN
MLTSGSPSQRALARRIAGAKGVELVGVISQRIVGTASMGWALRALRKQPDRLMTKVVGRLLYGGALAAQAQAEVARFGEAAFPDVPRFEVDDINAPDTVAALREMRPDLICVSGARMVKAPVFEVVPTRGLLNLHTGLSPYYKGGPNCTLWCLANGEPQYIGATIHELDLGIDSGRLILTARTDVAEDDDAASLPWKTSEMGAGLYVRVLEAMARGLSPKSIDQRELGEGRTYYTREWTSKELGRALRFVRSGGVARWVRDGRLGEVRLFDGISQSNRA